MYLLTLATKYPGYLNQFYTRHHELLARSYQEQYRGLMSDSFGSSEIWSVGMAQRGYQTERIFANARPIQQRWARENKLEFDEQNWRTRILSAQVKCLRPDIIFINNHTLLSIAELRKLRQENPSIKLVIVWCGTPYQTHDIFHEFDIILSNIPEFIKEFKNQQLRAYHINHAFDPRILEHINTTHLEDIDLSFIGSIIMETNFHIAREQLLLELARKTDIQIWGNITPITIKHRIRNLILPFAYDAVQLGLRAGIQPTLLQHIPFLNKIVIRHDRPSLKPHVNPYLVRRTRSPVYGLDMFQRLHDSRITLNTHVDISSKSASNMRLFESTGVGTCLLTDWKENLRDLFEPDIEVVTYRDSKECIEKIQYLLKNENERQTIAEAGKKRTLQNHTIYHRAEQIDEIIREYIRKV